MRKPKVTKNILSFVYLALCLAALAVVAMNISNPSDESAENAPVVLKLEETANPNPS